MLGHELGSLVGAGQVADIGVGRLVARPVVSGRLEPENANSGGVNQSLALRRPDRGQHVEGPADVHLIEDPGVARPEPVDRRQVEDEAGTRAGTLHGGGIADIRHDPLGVDDLEVEAVISGLHEGNDVRAPACTALATADPINPEAPVMTTRSPGSILAVCVISAPIDSQTQAWLRAWSCA